MDDDDILKMLNSDSEEENPDLARAGTIVKDEKVQPPIIDEIAEVTEELWEKLSERVTKIATERLIKNDPLVAKPSVEEVLEIHEDGTVTPYEELEDPKAECLRQITNILGEYGLESNIPVNHLYWKLINNYRVM